MKILNGNSYRLVLIFIICQTINSVHATNYSWKASGTDTSWATSSNWSPPGVPTTNDTVTIAADTAIYKPYLDHDRTVTKFTMTSGTLNLNAYNLTISKTASFTAGTITNGKIYPNGVQATYSGTTFNCEVNSVAGKVFLSGSTFNYRCYFEDTITNNSHEGAGGCTFNASVVIKKNSGANFGIAGTSGNTFNDTVTFLSVRGVNNFTVTDQGTSYFNGNVIVGSNTNGDIYFSGAATLASGKTISVDGTTGFAAGTLHLNNFTQSGSTSQSFTLTGAATVSCYNATWNGAVSITAPHVLLKTTTFNSTTSFYQTHATIGSNSDGGNTFNGAATLNCSGAVFRMGTTYDDTFNSDLTVIGGVTMAYSNTTILKGNLTAAGNLQFNGTGVSGTLKFGGSNSQHISSTGVIAFNKIKIDKTGGSVTLDTTITVDDTLTFVTGNFITTSSHLLSMLAGSTVTGASNSSFVSGPLKKTGNTTFVFPTGKGSDYRSVSISAPSSATDAFTGEYLNTGQSLGNSMDGTIKYIHNCGYWNFARNTGSSNVTVSLSWDSAACDLLDSATVKVGNWNGSIWKDLGNGGVTGNKYVGKVANSTTVITWGNFALAYNKCFLTANAGSDQALCAGDSVIAGASPVAGGLGTGSFTYAWSPSTGLSSTSTANPKASPSSTTNYIVTVTDAAGCSVQDTSTVAYHARPTASAGADQSFCDGSSVAIGGSPTASGGTSPYTYSWNPSTGLSSGSTANPTANPTSSTSYIVTVTDVNGCTKKDTVAVGNNTITYTWIGATSTAWETSSNWSPTGVPDSCDNVIIVSGSNSVVTNSVTYVNSLTINSGTLETPGNYLAINRKGIFNSGTINGAIFPNDADSAIFNGTYFGTDAYMGGTAKNVLLNGCMFDGIFDMTQTGNANTYSSGGNVFNSSFTIANSGTGNLYLATSSEDIFNDAAGFSTTGTGFIYPNYTKNSTFKSELGATNHVTFGLNGGKAIFTGTGDHILNTDSLVLFKKFILNKSSGDLTSYGRLTIGDSLILTKGKIFSDTLNFLVMNAGSVVSGVSDSSFVSGPVKKIGNTAFVFPTGKGSFYKAIEISSPSSSTEAFTAEYFDTGQTLGSSADNTIKYISPCNYWKLLRSSGTSDVTIKLNWNSASCNLVDTTFALVANWNGSLWKNLRKGGITGNNYLGKIANLDTAVEYGYFSLAYNHCFLTANAGNDKDICSGDSTDLGGAPLSIMGTPPFAYAWSPSLYLIDSTIANPITIPDTTTDFYVFITDAMGCSQQDSVTVTFHSRPTVSAGSDQLIFSGDSIPIGGSPTASGGASPYTYTWSPTSGMINYYRENPEASPTSNIDYIIHVSDGYGCDGWDTVSISISNDTIEVPEITPDSLAFCPGYGEPFTITILNPQERDVKYLWYVNGIPDTTISDTASSYTVSTPPERTTTYQVRAYYNFYNMKSSSIATIEVNKVAPNPILTGPDCWGESTAVISSTGRGGNGTYEYALDSGTFSSTSSWNSLDVGAHTIGIRDSDGCESTLDVEIPMVNLDPE